METDEAIEQLLQGDEQGLERLRTEFEPRITSMLRQQFGSGLSREDIDDAFAVGLYRLWISRDRYDANRSSFFTWFYLIVRNAAIDLIRRRKIHDTETKPEPLEASPAEAAPSLNEHERNMATSFIESLSNVDQIILHAFAAQGDTSNWAVDIAAELQMPASTVRVRKLRLVKKIKQLLGRT